jgi:hypothetical protein
MTEFEITKEVLINQLNLTGSNRAAARALGVDEATIRRAKERFGVQTEKSIDSSIVMALRETYNEPDAITIQKAKKIAGEALVIHFSDWHLGSIVKDERGKVTYDKFIAKKRADDICSRVFYLLQKHITEGTKITEIDILITGDMVDGEGIYPGQAWRTEEVPPKQVMLVVDTLRAFINALLKTKLPIFIYAVLGNHGGTGKEKSVDSNWDVMSYLILADWVNTKKLDNVFVTVSDAEYLNCEIMGWKYSIRHKGPKTADAGGDAGKIGGWKSFHDCDALAYGHWHHQGLMEASGVQLFMSPSLKGPDEFSESIAKNSLPAQCIWGVTRSHIYTFYYRVDFK